mgnify:CR=1 FL=1
MYKIDMKKIREEKDILQCAKDMKEAAKKSACSRSQNYSWCRCGTGICQ